MKIGRCLFGISLIAFLLFTSVPIFGAPHGDFLTFSLGDSQGIVEQKLAALKKAKEVDGQSPDLFRARYLNRSAECSLGFSEGKLYDIWVKFELVAADRYGDQLRKALLDEINPALIKIYADPSSDYGFPEQGEVGEYILPVLEWDLEGKTVLSGILQVDGQYQAVIEIFDNVLMAAADEAEQKKKAENSD